MKFQRLTVLLAFLVSFVLLYYSVAWAVLICLHAENDSSGVVVLAEAGSHAEPFSAPHRRELIDCSIADYHLEALAVPSSNFSVDRFIWDLWSSASELSGSPILGCETWPGPGRNNVSPTGSPPYSLPDLPLYLSLTVLRI